VLASLVVQLGGANLVRSTLGARRSNVLRVAIALTLFAALAGASAWLLANTVAGVAGLAGGALLGAAVFGGVAFFADRGFKLGIRESLGVFFPKLAAQPG
jgi:hypothetical protein